MTRSLSWLVGLRVLLILAAVIMSATDRLPWWFTALIVARDLAMGGVIALRRLRTDEPVRHDPVAPVAGGLLLVGLALIAPATGDGAVAVLARVFGWAAAWWGLGLSWASLAGHTRDLQRLIAPRRDRAGAV
ncbi:CDP-alcohol phosphatidyltransferase family protein [Nocardioides sp. Kera G14]|uniref:CDP-alcohol phosphatidyltransferase family protein n=1 Tax=Nocardioides sp. Kera G14 TaxID=2884264 RepID=UPI001D10AA7D|nr:CDP-alcohol phosphatidyltransferase family protein [Nocardioides sp. Kera G14]UDY25250.1 hypothetical protein LH076_08180 [Nocardioides sp. Kera G14]